MALFRGPPGWVSARRELLDFIVQGKINRGRHTDHPAGRHAIRTNQCLLPPSPHIFCRPDVLPPAQPTASKHWRLRRLYVYLLSPLKSQLCPLRCDNIIVLVCNSFVHPLLQFHPLVHCTTSELSWMSYQNCSVLCCVLQLCTVVLTKTVNWLFSFAFAYCMFFCLF